MLRKLLAVVVLLALPAVLAGQRAASMPRGSATQVMGEVAGPAHVGPIHADVQSGGQKDVENEDVNEVNGDNNDVNDGDLDQEGIDEHDGVNNDAQDAAEHASQAGEENDQSDETPAPPPGAAQQSRVGRHKP